MAIIPGNPVGTTMPRPDWNQTDPTKADYIKNKPVQAIEEVETHNFGEDNIINTKDSCAVFGNSNTVGGKGYKIKEYYYGFAHEVTLDPNVTVYEGTTSFVIDQNSSVSIGDVVSVEMNDSTQRFATVSDLQYNNDCVIVVVDKCFYDDFVVANRPYGKFDGHDVSGDNYYLILPDYDKLGNDDVAETGYAFGSDNRTIATNAFATGSGNSAEGRNSFVSGKNNTAGYAALVGGEENVITAEHGFGVGYKNTATERYAAAIGYANKAKGPASLAVGDNTEASGLGSFSAGYKSKATGAHSHAEGAECVAQGVRSHVEGYNNLALGYATHAEGASNSAEGDFSHSEGHGTHTKGASSHAEGEYTTAHVENAHAEGYNTNAKGRSSHTEGEYTTTEGLASHAEGVNSKATKEAAHAEGYGTTASGMYGHAEGSQTVASGESSHAEGIGSKASASFSHAQNCYTEASGARSHAEGNRSKAIGESSHAGGGYSEASGNYSFAHGYYAKAGYDHQVVVGQYNANKEDTVFEVGNGTSVSKRSNALEVKKDGSGFLGSKEIATKEEWISIADIKLTEEVASLEFTTDINGNPFECKRIIFWCYIPNGLQNTESWLLWFPTDKASGAMSSGIRGNYYAPKSSWGCLLDTTIVKEGEIIHHYAQSYSAGNLSSPQELLRHATDANYLTSYGVYPQQNMSQHYLFPTGAVIKVWGLKA